MLSNLLKYTTQTVRGFVNWISGVPGDVYDAIRSAIDSFFGMLMGFLWAPIRDFLAGPIGVIDLIINDLESLANALWNTLNRIYKRFYDLTEWAVNAVNDIWGTINDLIFSLPDRVLTIVVNGFLDIVSPIGDLLERYIVDHWDE